MVQRISIADPVKFAAAFRDMGFSAPMASRTALVDALPGMATRDDGEVIWAGGLGFRWSEGATTISDLPGLIPADETRPSAAHWGVVGQTNTGNSVFTGDYSAEIQAAIDWLESRHGGVLLLPHGVIPIATKIHQGEGPGVMVRGMGRGTFGGTKSEILQSAGTRLFWTGSAGGTMWEISSDSSNSGSNRRYAGGGLTDVMLDGAESAGTCLDVLSHAGHELKTFITYATQMPFKANALSNDVDSNSSPNIQRATWDLHINSSHTETTEPPALCWISGRAENVEPTVSGNFSVAEIKSLHLRAHDSAVGAHLESMDSAVIHFLHSATIVSVANAVGDGGKVFLHAGDTLPAEIGTASGRHCRSNYFGFVQCKNGLVSKTDLGGGFPAEENVIGMWSNENGAADEPTIESGSTLYYTTSKGAVRAQSIRGEAIIGTVNHTNGVSTGAIYEYGSSGDSHFLRYADGTLICWTYMDLVYSAASNLTDTWVYPAAFTAAPSVTATMNDGVGGGFSATPTLQELSNLGVNSVTVGSCRPRLYRITGMTDFVSGDTVRVYVIAAGRWVT